MSADVFRALFKLPRWIPVFAATLVCAMHPRVSSAQSVAEAAGATSVSGGIGSAIKPIQFPKIPGPSGAPAAAGSSTGSSTHIIASSAPAPQETNVRDFQLHAGKDASKILIRATPAEAQIWVNGKIVGKTPMLLVLAPGKYQVEMRGARGETGASAVDLLPRETRELTVRLQQLYPGRVTAQH